MPTSAHRANEGLICCLGLAMALADFYAPGRLSRRSPEPGRVNFRRTQSHNRQTLKRSCNDAKTQALIVFFFCFFLITVIGLRSIMITMIMKKSTTKTTIVKHCCQRCAVSGARPSQVGTADVYLQDLPN
jgi:hypothetical protein